MRLLTDWWKHGFRRKRAKIGPVVDSSSCGLVDAVKGGWFQNDSAELFKGFPIAANDVVLDLGCGEGGMSLFCARQGAHVIFTDSESDKVERLNQKMGETNARIAEGIVSDSLPLPLDGGIATKIVALEVLEHVENPDQVLRELTRVGQPGALYFLSVPDSRSEQLQQSIAPAVHFQTPNHIHIFGRDHFAQLIEDAGLEIVSRHYYGFYWTFWMMLFWATKDAEGFRFEGATHDQLNGAHSPLLDDWANVWHQLIHLPGGDRVRNAMDEALPKTQIILARKPPAVEKPNSPSPNEATND